jgi:hypothetical protein
MARRKGPNHDIESVSASDEASLDIASSVEVVDEQKADVNSVDAIVLSANGIKASAATQPHRPLWADLTVEDTDDDLNSTGASEMQILDVAASKRECRFVSALTKAFPVSSEHANRYPCDSCAVACVNSMDWYPKPDFANSCDVKPLNVACTVEIVDEVSKQSEADGYETDHDVDEVKLMAAREFNDCQVQFIELDVAKGRLEIIIKARRSTLVVRHGRARDFGARVLRGFWSSIGRGQRRSLLREGMGGARG